VTAVPVATTPAKGYVNHAPSAQILALGGARVVIAPSRNPAKQGVMNIMDRIIRVTTVLHATLPSVHNTAYRIYRMMLTHRKRPGTGHMTSLGQFGKERFAAFATMVGSAIEAIVAEMEVEMEAARIGEAQGHAWDARCRSRGLCYDPLGTP